MEKSTQKKKKKKETCKRYICMNDRLNVEQCINMGYYSTVFGLERFGLAILDSGAGTNIKRRHYSLSRKLNLSVAMSGLIEFQTWKRLLISFNGTKYAKQTEKSLKKMTEKREREKDLDSMTHCWTSRRMM